MRALTFAALFAGMACLVCLSDDSDARPGGGRSYRSSSSSYRGSYRSSSGSTGSSYRRSSSSSSSGSTYRRSSGSTVVVVPTGGGGYSSGSGSSSTGIIVTVIVVALVLGLIIWAATRKKTRERAKLHVDPNLRLQGIAALRQRDPAFDPIAFAERTKQTMAKTNEAWLAGDMGATRRLLSDGVYIRFQTQLALMKLAGVRNVMAEWSVVSADILAAEADELWDTVHVKVVGKARDTEVPLDLDVAAAQKKAMAAPLEEYHEVWSFIRRRGEKSKAGIPALEGRCPGCGADMPISDAVRCEYCKAIVNSGEHDWVLAEITQPEEWSTDIAQWNPPGLDDLRQRDQTISRQELEDRAAVIFWKWVEARATGKAAKLARFCTFPPQMPDPRYALDQAKLTEATLGSSEVAQVVAGQAGGQDLVNIEMRWSAGVNGAEPDNMCHVFTLARSADAMSKRRLASLDCPVCAGPLAGSDAVTCEYCGETLSGGKHEWALDNVQELERMSEEEEMGEED